MIHSVELVGHQRKQEFEQNLNDAIRAAQSTGFEVEVQYKGKQSGYYNALLIKR